MNNDFGGKQAAHSTALMMKGGEIRGAKTNMSFPPITAGGFAVKAIRA
jgi:hypothetical protein